MSRRRQLSEEEQALWAGVVRSIMPLRGSEKSAKRTDTTTDPTAPAARRPAAHTPAAREPGVPRAVSLRPNGTAPTAPLAPLGRRLKQRVARGREPIDARIDLHGLTQRQAHGALLRFLERSQAEGARMALVVTGKGVGKSERGNPVAERGVLRRQVPLWLALPEFRSFVVGFEDAHIGHGGEGALYVRLRRRQQPR